jgi:hypothetical protein
LTQIREARALSLHADTRIRFDEQDFVLAASNGDLVMEGELADIAVKRRAAARSPTGSASRRRKKAMTTR